MKRGPTVPPAHQVPMGLLAARGAAVEAPGGQSSDPLKLVGACRAKTGLRRKPDGSRTSADMARRTPTSPDRTLDGPATVYD